MPSCKFCSFKYTAHLNDFNELKPGHKKRSSQRDFAQQPKKMRISWVQNKTPPSFEQVMDILKSSFETNQVTNGGPCTKRLERLIADVLEIDTDNRSVIAVCNGAAGLHAIAVAIDMFLNDLNDLNETTPLSTPTTSNDDDDDDDDQVMRMRYATQAFSFPCSAQTSFAHRTEIIDVNEQGTIDMEKLSPSTNGLVVTNVFGYICGREFQKYLDWKNESRERRFLIFDNAAAPFSQFRGKNINNYGDACMVSLHHTKIIGFGEGGVVIVRKDLEKYVRRAINFGFDNILHLAWSPEATNGKISDVAAAFCINHIEHNAKSLMECCRRITRELQQIHEKSKFKSEWSLLASDDDDSTENIPSVLCILMKDEHVASHVRNSFIQSGVEARQYYRPLMPLENATSIYKRIVCLPSHDAYILEHLQRFDEILQNAIQTSIAM